MAEPVARLAGATAEHRVTIEDGEMESASVKKCIKCGMTLALANFGIKTSNRDGVSTSCKACERARHAAFRERYPESKRASSAAWRQSNVAAKRSYDDAWKAANAEKVKAAKRKQNRRVMASPRGKLESAVRTGIRRGLAAGSKAGRRTFDILGYTTDQLIAHLESKFSDGMSWSNYGSEWHVDHIVPVSAFNYTSINDIDFKRAWCLDNLQPLWAAENLKKGAKLSVTFQPSLALAA